MKLASRSRDAAIICIAPLIETVKALILFCPNREIWHYSQILNRAILLNGVSKRVVIDKSAANFEGVRALNTVLKFTGQGEVIAIFPRKDLNTIVEQGHRFIKRLTKSMMGLKEFPLGSCYTGWDRNRSHDP